MNTPQVALLSSAALGEALLYLATNSLVQITDRRVILMREFTRLEIYRSIGVEEKESGIPSRLYAGEKFHVITELRRAATYGMRAALQRYGTGNVPSASAALHDGATRPAA